MPLVRLGIYADDPAVFVDNPFGKIETQACAASTDVAWSGRGRISKTGGTVLLSGFPVPDRLLPGAPPHLAC